MAKMMAPWSKMKGQFGKLAIKTPPPDDDFVESKRQDFWHDVCLASGIWLGGLLPGLAVGIWLCFIFSPLVIRPDYSDVQRYFEASGDRSTGEHAVEVFKARDHKMFLAMKLVLKDAAQLSQVPDAQMENKPR